MCWKFRLVCPSKHRRHLLILIWECTVREQDLPMNFAWEIICLCFQKFCQEFSSCVFSKSDLRRWVILLTVFTKHETGNKTPLWPPGAVLEMAVKFLIGSELLDASSEATKLSQCHWDCSGILSGATFFSMFPHLHSVLPLILFAFHPQSYPLSTSAPGCDYWHECIDDQVAEVPAVNWTKLYCVRVKHGGNKWKFLSGFMNPWLSLLLLSLKNANKPLKWDFSELFIVQLRKEK